MLSDGSPLGQFNAPIVGIAGASQLNSYAGYWLVASDGGVFAYGGVGFFGSAAALHLDAPIVGIASTPDDLGYFLVSADGGVFAYGDAVFNGSLGGKPLNAPIVGMAIDPLTGGCRLVAADGGVFDFGAPFLGSAAGAKLNGPVVGIATDRTTGGYWLAAPGRRCFCVRRTVQRVLDCGRHAADRGDHRGQWRAILDCRSVREYGLLLKRPSR